MVVTGVDVYLREESQGGLNDSRLLTILRKFEGEMTVSYLCMTKGSYQNICNQGVYFELGTRY